MVDNFNYIRPLLKFDNKDQFYFIQILQRKKDHKQGKVNGTNNNSRLVKAYYVKSLEHLYFIEPEVKELCKLFNARAGINLNRRSFKKMALQHLKKITDQILNESYDKSYKAYSSVVGAFSNESDKRWILDIDDMNIYGFIESTYAAELHSFLKNTQPVGDKVIIALPTKSGVHVITKPFNLIEFKKVYSEIEVHKNNPVNLYIP